MSYYDVCAANPAKTSCPFSCTCQGHHKVYPNQACICPQPVSDAVVQASIDSQLADMSEEFQADTERAEAIADAILDDEGGVLSSLNSARIYRMLVRAAREGARPF